MILSIWIGLRVWSYVCDVMSWRCSSRYTASCVRCWGVEAIFDNVWIPYSTLSYRMRMNRLREWYSATEIFSYVFLSCMLEQAMKIMMSWGGSSDAELGCKKVSMHRNLPTQQHTDCLDLSSQHAEVLWRVGQVKRLKLGTSSTISID
jgi:hypothetical protein